MNIKFNIEYKGTNFHGWQLQKNIPTIQGELNKAFKILLPTHSINIIASGRTDTGVHAHNQVASVKLPENLDLKTFFRSINGIIDNDIYIRSYNKVDDNFNARFSARARSYKYHIHTKFSPFKTDISWFISHKINTQNLEECAQALIGKHDFSRLSKDNPEIENKNCIIYESFWEHNQNDLIYNIKANRFLHHMVRFIIGSFIEVAKSNFTFEDFLNLVNNKPSKIQPICAPAKGLFLYEVLYE